MGAEDDCVIAERLAQLCLAKYPSSLAIPPPTKFEKHNSSFNVQRTFSAPVFTDAEKVNQIFLLPIYNTFHAHESLT